MSDDEDLIGEPSRPKPNRIGRTKAAVLDDLVQTAQQARTYGGPMVEDMHRGVTVSWLSQVFGMDPKTVKQKLADCPPLHRRKAGYVYHLPTACRYLVPPAQTAEQYIKSMKPSDLPTALQQAFWDAALKQQKWEENAGQLWRTEKVRDILGSTFQTMKFTMQLWVDTLERQTGLSQEQRALLVKMVDGLQEEIYKALVMQASDNATGPQLSELEEMTSSSKETGVRDVDDWEDLI